MSLRTFLAWCVVTGTALAPLAACNDSVSNGAAKSIEAPIAVESLDHQPCDPKGHQTQLFDTRGDGKSVVTKVLDGTGKETCRITDINHDGKPDLYEYFDGSGTVTRREADYDSNGTIDSVETYEGGKLVKREYDTTGQHRVDTWDYFDKVSGRRVRRERDTTNDGRVDQWWTWEGDKITIAMDKDGDGKPDPGAVVVLDDKTGEAVKDAKTVPSAGAANVPAPPAASSSSSAAPPAAPPTSADPNAPPPPTAPQPTVSMGLSPPPPPKPAASAAVNAGPAISGAKK
jgi:hypothetical protein